MNFVGKAQRRWSHPTPMWAVRIDGWVLTITPSLTGDLLPLSWMLSHRTRPFHQSGIASTIHEAEQQATLATLVLEKGRGRCFVCGASASNRKIIYEPVRAVMLCDTHRSVCRTHQQDPCLECDSQ